MAIKSRSSFDRVILVDALILICVGIIAISSASIMESMMKYGDSMFQMKKHLISVVMSVVLALIALTVQTDFYKKAAPYLFILAIVMMIMTCIFIPGFQIAHGIRNRPRSESWLMPRKTV